MVATYVLGYREMFEQNTNMDFSNHLTLVHQRFIAITYLLSAALSPHSNRNPFRSSVKRNPPSFSSEIIRSRVRRKPKDETLFTQCSEMVRRYFVKAILKISGKSVENCIRAHYHWRSNPKIYMRLLRFPLIYLGVCPSIYGI